MAGGPVEAGSHGTVIDVLTAVLARPAIDTDTVVAPVVVVAGATVLAGVGHQLALVHILSAVLTCQGTERLHEAGTDHSRCEAGQLCPHCAQHPPGQDPSSQPSPVPPSLLALPVHSGGHWQL